jgi:hypothetical protein
MKGVIKLIKENIKDRKVPTKNKFYALLVHNN